MTHNNRHNNNNNNNNNNNKNNNSNTKDNKNSNPLMGFGGVRGGRCGWTRDGVGGGRPLVPWSVVLPLVPDPWPMLPNPWSLVRGSLAIGLCSLAL